ncbi:hypothetical protein CCP2SC5_140011 [Azospirillaceae bacterium]
MRSWMRGLVQKVWRCSFLLGAAFLLLVGEEGFLSERVVRAESSVLAVVSDGIDLHLVDDEARVTVTLSSDKREACTVAVSPSGRWIALGVCVAPLEFSVVDAQTGRFLASTPASELRGLAIERLIWITENVLWLRVKANSDLGLYSAWGMESPIEGVRSGWRLSPIRALGTTGLFCLPAPDVSDMACVRDARYAPPMVKGQEKQVVIGPDGLPLEGRYVRQLFIARSGQRYPEPPVVEVGDIEPMLAWKPDGRKVFAVESAVRGKALLAIEGLGMRSLRVDRYSLPQDWGKIAELFVDAGGVTVTAWSVETPLSGRLASSVVSAFLPPDRALRFSFGGAPVVVAPPIPSPQTLVAVFPDGVRRETRVLWWRGLGGL